MKMILVAVILVILGVIVGELHNLNSCMVSCMQCSNCAATFSLSYPPSDHCNKDHFKGWQIRCTATDGQLMQHIVMGKVQDNAILLKLIQAAHYLCQA